jgi:hypothetical protein
VIGFFNRKENMKKVMLSILPLLMGSFLLSGCIYSHRGAAVVTTEPVSTRTVVVSEAPPPPRTEVITTAPSESHVWVAGNWTYTDNRWIWMPGHWELRPRTSAMWMPGHWDKNPDGKGWTWTPGYWQ